MKKKKSKALKSDGNMSGCIFRAFFSGVAVSAVSLVVLCVAVSAFLSSSEDSTGKIHIISPVLTVISLLIGGFVCGKIAKGQGIAAAFLCGCACLGICYALSSILELGGSMGNAYKTFCICVMLVCPVLGAKISKGSSENRHARYRKNA